MKNLNKSIIASMVLASISFGSYANENSWKNESQDAWLDGKAETVLLFNSNLNNFDINTDVKNGTVILTGKVDNDVDKELAEELILSLDNVKSIDNQLVVVEDKNVKRDIKEDKDSLTNDLIDTKITTIVKTRYLFNSEVSGTDIEVETKNGVVTLNGDVDSEAEKDLAIEIAKNIDDVVDVEDNLQVIAD